MGQIIQLMSQAWSSLERSQPDSRLWILNVVALLRRENEQATQLGRLDLGGAWTSARPNMDKDDQI